MRTSRHIAFMSDAEELPEARRSASSYAVTAAAIAAVALLYFITGKLGLRLAFVHVSATPVWPPAGIAFVALLLLGCRMCPGVFIGAFLVNITTAGTALTAAGIATGNTLEAVAAAYLVNRFANGRHAFERTRDIVKVWVLAGLTSGAIGATFGATSLCATGFAEWTNYAAIWRTWWLGDATGCFLFGSVLLLWLTEPLPRWTLAQAVEAMLLVIVLVAVALMVFFDYFGQAYLALPLMLWAAFRFGTRETATTAVVLAGIAIWATLRHRGPFAGLNPNESLLELQAFMTISAVTTMVVAALVDERKRAAHLLAHAHERLEQRVARRTQELSQANDSLRVEIEERARAEAQLADAARRRQDDLRAFALEVQRAQEAERRRISRELHDGLGQRLSGLKMALQLLEDDAADKGLAPSSQLEQLSRDVDQMVVEVRRLSYNLRPAALDDFGLVAALDLLCKDFEKVHRIAVRLDADIPPIPHDSHVDIAIYRIVQEALANVAKHAFASRVGVELRGRDGAILVMVEDNGRGFDRDGLHTEPDGTGLGIMGMMERTQLLGGRFDVKSQIGGGTRIEAELPLGNARDEGTDSDTHRG